MALLGKWLWGFPVEQDSLWAKVIRSGRGQHKDGWGLWFACRPSS